MLRKVERPSREAFIFYYARVEGSSARGLATNGRGTARRRPILGIRARRCLVACHIGDFGVLVVGVGRLVGVPWQSNVTYSAGSGPVVGSYPSGLLTEHSRRHPAECAAVHAYSAERPPGLWKPGMTFRDTRSVSLLAFDPSERASSLRRDRQTTGELSAPPAISNANARIREGAAQWSTAYSLPRRPSNETTAPIAAASAGPARLRSSC